MYVEWADLKFSVIRLSDYLVQVVYSEDGTTYLFDRVVLRVQCVLNQDVNSGPTLTPTDATYGPARTYLTVLPKLRKPRQKLRVYQKQDTDDPNVQDVVILESPLTGYTKDATNGPRCRVHKPSFDKGTGSIIWDLEFQADVAPCTGTGSNQPPLILQNRYRMRVTYDPHSYREAYEYQGVAIFRTDVLAALGTSPDQYRSGLLPKCLDGYQRYPHVVELHENNTALQYHVIDRYMPKSQPFNARFEIAELLISEQRGYVSNMRWGSNGSNTWVGAAADWVWGGIKSIFK